MFILFIAFKLKYISIVSRNKIRIETQLIMIVVVVEKLVLVALNDSVFETSINSFVVVFTVVELEVDDVVLVVVVVEEVSVLNAVLVLVINELTFINSIISESLRLLSNIIRSSKSVFKFSLFGKLLFPT